jgi:hypothetical protein
MIKLHLTLLALIAIVLLLIDRQVRIRPYLIQQEGFQSSVVNTGARCGLDLPACMGNTKCGNGICIGTGLTDLVEKIPLPVLP